MLGVWDVQDVGYWVCGMLQMWDVGDVVGCWGSAMFQMWDVGDVVCWGCSGCEMLRI